MGGGLMDWSLPSGLNSKGNIKAKKKIKKPERNKNQGRTIKITQSTSFFFEIHIYISLRFLYSFRLPIYFYFLPFVPMTRRTESFYRLLFVLFFLSRPVFRGNRKQSADERWPPLSYSVSTMRQKPFVVVVKGKWHSCYFSRHRRIQTVTLLNANS